MKKYSLPVILILLLCLCLPVAAAEPFDDVQPGAWYYGYVMELTEKGILAGYGDGSFRPQNAISRVEFTKILATMSGEDVSGYSTDAFSDMPMDKWGNNYVAWAVTKGITEGTGNGRFLPDQPIARQQMAVMLSRYAAKVDRVTLPAGEPPIIFTDDAEIASWAVDAVAEMQTAGVISGNSDGSFAPANSADRAQTAAMVSRYLDAAKKGTNNGEGPTPTPPQPPAGDSTTLSGSYAVNGDVLIPARSALEYLGYTLTYFSRSGLLCADNGLTDILCWNGKSRAFVSGKAVSGCAATGSSNGSLSISVKILQACGAAVSVSDQNGVPQVTLGKPKSSPITADVLTMLKNAFYGKTAESVSGIANLNGGSGSYHGAISGGLAAGNGRYSGSNVGVRYYGGWANSLMQGNGRLVLQNGEVCIGSFAQGKFTNGSYYFIDGSVYQGGWNANYMYPSGQGTYTTAAGKTYSGDWGSYGAIKAN